MFADNYIMYIYLWLVIYIFLNTLENFKNILLTILFNNTYFDNVYI